MTQTVESITEEIDDIDFELKYIFKATSRLFLLITADKLTTEQLKDCLPRLTRAVEVVDKYIWRQQELRAQHKELKTKRFNSEVIDLLKRTVH